MEFDGTEILLTLSLNNLVQLYLEPATLCSNYRTTDVMEVASDIKPNVTLSSPTLSALRQNKKLIFLEREPILRGIRRNTKHTFPSFALSLPTQSYKMFAPLPNYYAILF